jgi:hypothetical protein
LNSVGGLTSFKDLSMSMLGDDALFAARECTEVPEFPLICLSKNSEYLVAYPLSFLWALFSPL